MSECKELIVKAYVFLMQIVNSPYFSELIDYKRRYGFNILIADNYRYLHLSTQFLLGDSINYSLPLVC